MSKPIYLFSTSSHPDAISINSLEMDFFKPQADFSLYDYFIITSKQVSKVLEFYKSKDMKPALCISKGTAASYKKIGGEVLGVGKGYGDTLLDTIKQHPKSTKWLYLRAKVVASDFVHECQDEGYDIDECVVYESRCSQAILDIEVQEDGIFIFTSPSSVECFLKNHIFSEKAKIIVIGKTTAKTLPTNLSFTIAQEATIDSCMEIAQNI